MAGDLLAQSLLLMLWLTAEGVRGAAAGYDRSAAPPQWDGAASWLGHGLRPGGGMGESRASASTRACSRCASGDVASEPHGWLHDYALLGQM